MLPLTSMVAALAAVALFAMSIAVSLRRMKVGVNIGFGDDALLMRRIRAQGNFTEYVPLALILLALAEYRQAPELVLWTIAGLLIVGRCLHFVGIMTGTTALRVPGMVGTYSALLVGAGALLFA
ncbi:MAPEG family protein [Mesorhizobium marinum]|uniref:MAPEG family protein n=1 Tax=Mesorhizobium marinum TaxID=3228790 RepID=UPI003466FD7C